MSTTAWLASQTTSLLPNLFPNAEATASCQYNYWSSCQFTAWPCDAIGLSFFKKYWYSSCGGVIGWRQSGCCY